MNIKYIEKPEEIELELKPYNELNNAGEYDIDRIIFDLNSKIDMLSSQADRLDYIVAIASGIVCGMMDILWTGDFDLKRGREIASDKVDNFVKKTAKMLGCKNSDDLSTAVKFLEKKFPLASDGNTPDFGGGLQHHLRDFAHHPTIVGLIFSLLTQFSGKSYGTDVNGVFLIVNVPEESKIIIGKDIPEKIFMGTIVWFFHLVSDMAGSGATAGLSGGTGIPGPLLALAKEISAIPIFKNVKVKGDSFSIFLSKLFNGTLLAKRDKNGKMIKDSVLKMDLRGELGLGVELARQAVPVAANECIVRGFYFIRRLAMEMRRNQIRSLEDMKSIDWEAVKPADNPTISRMLTVATGVFTGLDIGEAVVSQKYWVSINYVGIGRFAVAIGEDIGCCLKARNVKKIKNMYANIRQNIYRKMDNDIYERVGKDMDIDKMGLTQEQTEILYNMEYYKTLNDINCTKVLIRNDSIKELKQEWLEEWKQYMSRGFAGFLQIEGAELHWYTQYDLIRKITECEPKGTWFRLALLEAMIFEPYYPLSLEKDKKGNDIPGRKYQKLQNVLNGFQKSEGDKYLDTVFAGMFCEPGYVKRLRKCYDKCMRELNEVTKTVITSLSVTAVIAIIVVATAGAFAPAIATTLVGSNFAGLSGAVLTNACLAYLGGGAIAVGGAGMAGGTMAIVGGGAMLGLGMGAGVGGAVGVASLSGKKNIIMQSAKLLVSVREIFLNDEHDLAFSNSVYEKYLENIMEIEKGLVELKLQADVAKGDEKKKLMEKIKKAEESVEAMKIARKSMLKFHTSFAAGMAED